MTNQKLEEHLQARVPQAQVGEAIEQTKEGVQRVLDTYLSFLEQIISSLPSGGMELGEKLKIYAETNIAATRDYVHELSTAKDFQDVLRIQTQFTQSQLTALGEQTRSLGEACAKAAADAISRPFGKAA